MKYNSKTVWIFDGSRNYIPAQARVKEYSKKEAFFRGAKRSAKICGGAALLTIPLGVIEPFLYMIWGSVTIGTLVFLLGPLLHLKFSGETLALESIDTPCPKCKAPGPLKPFLTDALSKTFKLHCKSCGDTHSATTEKPDPNKISA